MWPRGIICVVATLVWSVGMLSCGKGVGPDPGDSLEELKRIISQTPREDAEAELAALWLSGKLAAPESLYVKLRDGLKYLRDIYSDSISEVNIHFIFPVVPSSISLKLTDSAASALRDGRYTEWDTLNALFRVTEIDTTILFTNYHFVYLKFEGRLHPEVLASYYEKLRGIIYAGSNGFAGDWSNLYPWMVGDGLTFLARDAWGDCPSGCIHSHFWYFKESESGIDFVGDWDGTTLVPRWWDEAKVAYYTYRGFEGR